MKREGKIVVHKEKKLTHTIRVYCIDLHRWLFMIGVRYSNVLGPCGPRIDQYNRIEL